MIPYENREEEKYPKKYACPRSEKAECFSS
jgi:hypothetical protein